MLPFNGLIQIFVNSEYNEMNCMIMLNKNPYILGSNLVIKAIKMMIEQGCDEVRIIYFYVI